MPISPPNFTAAFSVIDPALGLTGTAMSRFAAALSTAIYNWTVTPTNVRLTGVTTGTAGAGNVTGKLIVPPAPQVMQAGFLAAGVTGPQSSRVATAISSAISTAFTATGGYTGPSAGVGVGTDASKVTVANAATLASQLMAVLVPILGGSGPAASTVARGISIGVAGQLLLGTGIGVVAGSVSPTPSVGTSSGQVI